MHLVTPMLIIYGILQISLFFSSLQCIIIDRVFLSVFFFRQVLSWIIFDMFFSRSIWPEICSPFFISNIFLARPMGRWQY